MTREQVDALCAVALMQAGLVRPTPPEPFTEAKPELRTVTRYRVKCDGQDLSGLFLTHEAASQVAALRPRRTDRKYLGNSYRNQLDVEEATAGSYTVEAVEVVEEAEYNRMQLALDKWAQAKDRADAERYHYNTAVREAEKATKGIWEDWNGLQQRKQRISEARLRFAEYVDLCNGDKVAARKFLKIVVEKDQRERDDGDGFISDALGDEGLPQPEPTPPPHAAFEAPASAPETSAP